MQKNAKFLQNRKCEKSQKISLKILQKNGNYAKKNENFAINTEFFLTNAKV